MDHYLAKKKHKKEHSELERPPTRDTASLEASKLEQEEEEDIPQKVTPHQNVNKNVNPEPHIKDQKTPLYKHFGPKYSICMVLGLILNTCVLIASHVGVSAVVRGSNDPEGPSTDLVGTCTNNEDGAILQTGSEALESSSIYLREFLAECGPNSACIEQRIFDRFQLSFDCSNCLAEYGVCLERECAVECLVDPFDADVCDSCSDLHCEFELEFCSGIDFVPDIFENSCVNEKDDLVFTDGSAALTTLTTYLPQAGFDCFSAEVQITCVKETLIDTFGMSEDCSGCMFTLLECMDANCRQDCLIGALPKPECEPCLESTCEDDFEDCSGIDFLNVEGAAPTPQPSSGNCDNVDDLAILTPGSEALTQSAVYLPQIAISCFQSGNQDPSCVSDAVIARFGLSQECADCTPDYAGCLLAECEDCRLQTFDQSGCEACSNAKCELDFEVCTGVNFVEDVAEDACINENDDAVFVPGSTALEQTTTYLPQAARGCFQAGAADLELCVKEAMQADFGMGEDCATCMFKNVECIVEFCQAPCFGQGPEACEACLVANVCEEQFETCTGIDFYVSTAAPTAQPVDNACDNVNDLAILTPGSEALTQSAVYLPQIAVGCFQSGNQEPSCVSDAVVARFGLSQECADCTPDYATCLLIECEDCRLQSFDQTGCEACSNAKCELNFEVCTGVNFVEDVTQDACINENDDAVFVENSTALEQTTTYLPQAAIACFQAGAADLELCVKETMQNDFGMGEDCATCMFKNVECIVGFCQQPCFGLGPEACEACLVANPCEQQFENCTGIDFYNNPAPRLLQTEDDNFTISFSQGGQCLDKDQFEIFDNVELTFVFSLEKTIEGGSIALALLIGLASGVWPYAKNLLMAVAWFADLSQRQRDIILRTLAIMGKWSLVDVFAIVLIVDGALLQFILTRRGLPFLIFAESRQGIYWFGIAAVWALAQGEYIRYLEKTHLRQRNIAEGGSVVGDLDEKERKNTIYKNMLGIFAAISFVFSVIGFFLVNLEMNVLGKITEVNEGPSNYEYNVFQLAEALVDSCALHNVHGSKAGAWFLASLFILLVVVVPLVTCLLMYYVSHTFHPSKRDNFLIGFTFGLGNFACLDVWFISLFVFSNQFEGLISGALGDNAFSCDITPEEIDAGEICVGLSGETQVGGWLLLVAAVSFWFAQYAAVGLMQNSFHFVGTYIEYNTSL